MLESYATNKICMVCLSKNALVYYFMKLFALINLYRNFSHVYADLGVLI